MTENEQKTPAPPAHVAWDETAPSRDYVDTLKDEIEDLRRQLRAAKDAHLSIVKENDAAAPQCCMCGKKNLSTVEGDGGTECELEDGRWVCSAACWDRAVEPTPAQHGAPCASKTPATGS